MASVARPAHRSGARGRSSSVRARFLDRIRLAIGATARPCSSDPGDDQVVSLHAALYLIGHDAAANIRLFTEVPVRRILETSAVMSSRKAVYQFLHIGGPIGPAPPRKTLRHRTGPMQLVTPMVKWAARHGH